MKRVTKKEREQLKAEEAAALEQIARWVSSKAEISLIFVGPFFAAGMEGHLEQESGDRDGLEFFGSQTSFRASISFARCQPMSVVGPDKRILVWLQGPTRLAVILCDPDRRKFGERTADLLKLSGGRPN